MTVTSLVAVVAPRTGKIINLSTLAPYSGSGFAKIKSYAL